MNTRPCARTLIAATVALSLLILATAVAAGPLRRDRDGPSASRVKLLEMVREARKANAEALKLRREAVEGKIPDRSKSRSEDRKERWIELTDKERLSRFASAKKLHTTAVTKSAEIQQYVKKHPGVALEGTPETGIERLKRDYGLTLVAEARFRMSEKIGTIRDWQRLAAQALKLDKTSTEAQRLNQELKDMLKQEQEARKKELEEKKKAAAEKRKAAQEKKVREKDASLS